MRQEAARWITATRQEEAEAQTREQRPHGPRLALDNDVTVHSTALKMQSAKLEVEPALEDLPIIAPASADPGLSQEPRHHAQETL